MKGQLMTILFTTAIVLFLLSGSVLAQLNFVVNSLADDQYSYAYDDPSTPEDESSDGICEDELGRCTIRAAIEEAFNMNTTINLTFSASGTINLIDYLNLPDGSSIDGNNQITLTNPMIILDLIDGATITGLKFANTMVAINIQGNNNKIGTPTGSYNEFVNCQTAIGIDGDDNEIYNSFFGITYSNSLQPCGTGIIISGNYNQIGRGDVNASNIFCGSTVAGIIIGTGEGNIIEGNYIGTNIEQHTGLGNAIGVSINSDNNLIGGSGTFSANVISGNQIAVGIQAAPPDSYADNNLIVNNIIGLNKFENAPIPNNNGIMITNGVTNAKIYDNTIAGNNSVGVGIFGYDDESYTSGHQIYRNKIGINKNGVQYANNVGVSIIGNVGQVTIGVNQADELHPNTIVGNSETGIEIESFGNFSPSRIGFRKNLIYQNSLNNLYMDAQSNNGLSAPHGLSFNGNTLTGTHPISGMIIDVYRANNNEFAASAYEWLGSTTTDASGAFSFFISDPSVPAVTLTATKPLLGTTSPFVKYSLVTFVEDEKQIPAEFSLAQNYPNPFNPSTKIRFAISEFGFTSLKIYDLLGNEIATLVNEEKPAGVYEVEFNSHSGGDRNLTSGVYFYQLKVIGPEINSGQGIVQTRKMILAK